MGIIYYVKLRACSLKNPVEKQWEREEIENTSKWTASSKKGKKKYLRYLKKNSTILNEFYCNPGFKRNYTIHNFKVPEGANVLTCHNHACDRYDFVQYIITCYYTSDGVEMTKREVRTFRNEENKFIILLPDHTRHIRYEIENRAYTRIEHYDGEEKCETCNAMFCIC